MGGQIPNRQNFLVTSKPNKSNQYTNNHFNILNDSNFENETQPNPTKNYLKVLPFYNCNSDDLTNQLIDSNSDDYIRYFKLNYDTNFSILHLNIDRLFNKRYELNEILNQNVFDLVLLNETKLDQFTTDEAINNDNYQLLRRDRTLNGGGIVVYIRKQYEIIKQKKSTKH